MTASTSRKGNGYDNVSIESFLSTLKSELVHRWYYGSRQQAKEEVIEYVEMFYNRQQIQARLGCVSPAIFTRQYYLNQLAV